MAKQWHPRRRADRAAPGKILARSAAAATLGLGLALAAAAPAHAVSP